MDYNGLKQLQLYHYDLKSKNVKERIQTWLSEANDIYGINVKKIKDFFSASNSQNETKLENLTRDCWVTENEINEVFYMLNQQYDNIMCIVCTPDKYVSDFLMAKSKKNNKRKNYFGS